MDLYHLISNIGWSCKEKPRKCSTLIERCHLFGHVKHFIIGQTQARPWMAARDVPRPLHPVDNRPNCVDVEEVIAHVTSQRSMEMK